MNIDSTTATPSTARLAAGDPNKREKAALKQACAEVEGIFLTTLLKQGLKPALDETEERPKGLEQAQDFAIEQTARSLGHQGTFGLADNLYKDLSNLL